MYRRYRISIVALCTFVLCPAVFGHAETAAKDATPVPKFVYTLQEGDTIAEDWFVPIVHAIANGRVFLGLKNGDDYFVMAGAKRSGPFKALRLLVADASGVGYFCCKPYGNGYVVINDMEFGPYKDDGKSGAIIVNKAGSLFSALKDDGKWYVAIDGKESGPFEEDLQAAELNQAGYAYIAQKSDKKYYAVVNGVEYGPFAQAGEIALTKSGFAYTAQKDDGKWFVVVNRKENGPYESVSDLKMDQSGYGYGI